MQIYYDDHLAHYGIMGMKWGVRRYQNPDGTLTAAGRKRYGIEIKATGGYRLNKRGEALKLKAHENGVKLASSKKAESVISERYSKIYNAQSKVFEELDKMEKIESEVIKKCPFTVDTEDDAYKFNDWINKQPEIKEVYKNYDAAIDKYYDEIRYATKDISVNTIGDYRDQYDKLSEYEKEVERLFQKKYRLSR